jgi:uncharacterized protein (TIGR03437 family)
MRWNRILISIAMTAAVSVAPLAAATFGTVVPLTGHASDLALDEARGKLYIANFTANRIDVLSTSDNIVHSSINVGAQPGSLTLSRDGRFLVATNYSNPAPPSSSGSGSGSGSGSTTTPNTSLITVIDLTSNTRQTFSTGDPALGAAFFSQGNQELVLLCTTTTMYVFDPISGALQTVASFASLSKTLPVTQATFPGQVLEAALATAADHVHVWGVLSAGSGSPQGIFVYDATTGRLTADGWVTSPPLVPRISVAGDGTWAMIGWAAYAHSLCSQGANFMVRSRYPNPVASTNVTGHAIDSANNILYAQIPDATTPTNPPYSPTAPAGTASPAKLPALSIMDADNLTVRDKLNLPENMTGRALLTANGSILYAISDSGVMVLPVGSLNQWHRLQASTEDLLVQSSFCTRNAQKQTFTITDPGGNRTDFAISASQAGVNISPTSGTTPATITVTVDPNAVASTSGTLTVPITFNSQSAINAGPALRLLISSPDQDQRGSVVNVPGTLSDILPDPYRNRFYILRQDRNQVLVFDSTSNKQIAALRTGTTPNRMSFSSDAKTLIVASINSQVMSVFDLDALQPTWPIMLPAGHFGASVAQSNNATLALVENDDSDTIAVDRVNGISGCAYALPSLGIYNNDKSIFPPTSVLAPTPGQNAILMAAPNGNVMLYDAQADTFVLSRKDVATLAGAYAAADNPGSSSDVGTYVIGNYVFNPALVPMGTMDSSVGNTMGFAFTQGQSGYRVTGNTASGPGVIQNLPTLRSANVRPVRVAESPLISTTANPFVRTVAPLNGSIVVLTTSGFTVLAPNYDAAVAPPLVSAVVNAADGTKPVAPGGLISIYGSNMAATNVATSTVPLPTAMGQSCLVINGTLTPLIFVSPSQINAQLPSRVGGSATMTIHTPGGISDNFNFSVNATAPSVFLTGAAGPQTGIATIVRADNGQLVTPTNPIHSGDTLIIYLTGMGATSPAVDDGMPAPSSPLASALAPPTVTLGGAGMSVYWAGLVPGSVGLYQINATVPLHPTEGLDIPLAIAQGGSSTTLSVRVVK